MYIAFATIYFFVSYIYMKQFIYICFVIYIYIYIYLRSLFFYSLYVQSSQWWSIDLDITHNKYDFSLVLPIKMCKILDSETTRNKQRYFFTSFAMGLPLSKAGGICSICPCWKIPLIRSSHFIARTVRTSRCYHWKMAALLRGGERTTRFGI